MLFSVVIPCYNAENYIGRCLDSIIMQDFDDFEIVVINDGSTDGTLDILNDYRSRCPRLNVWSFENAGVSDARRKGVILSSGKYIIFVDSDDTIAPGLLSYLTEVISKNRSPDIVRYQANLVGDPKHKDHDRYNYHSNIGVVSSGMYALKMWSVPGKKYAVYWLYAFKKTVFMEFMFVPNLRCYEDVALIPILIGSSANVVTTDFVGYNYTSNTTNSLTNASDLDSVIRRAEDFHKAYTAAIENFEKIKGITPYDLGFFVTDYNLRLRKMYDSLPDEIKDQFAHWFE